MRLIKMLDASFFRIFISEYALVVYLIVFLALIGWLVFALINKESKTPEILQVSAKEAGENASQDKEGERKRFDGLSRIDEKKASYVRAQYDEGMSLQVICDDFRNYAASRLNLYYGKEDIRRFVAGMAVSHILILQGMSGTGKTSLAYAFGEFLGNPSTVVPVQPMWKERTDLVGYYNEFTGRFNETDLLKKMYEANYSKEIYITVLDEMNIARVEYYFAEFLSLLELPNEEERMLTVVSDSRANDPEQLKEGHILLPRNMWFVGTANNDDSTFAISDKVYDRAMILDLDKKAEAFVARPTRERHIRSEAFEELIEKAKKEYALTERNRRRLKALDEYMTEKFRVTFGNRIGKQIEEYTAVYVSCGGRELDALDDILSKKVMRKLGVQNPVYLKRNAGKLCEYMDEIFGAENMLLCKEVVRRLEKNV